MTMHYQTMKLMAPGPGVKIFGRGCMEVSVMCSSKVMTKVKVTNR